MKAAAVSFALLVTGCGHHAPLTVTPTPPVDTVATPPVAPPPPAPVAAVMPPERWAATLVQGGSFIEFVVVFTGPTEAHFVLAGDREVPLSIVTYASDQLSFTLQKPKAEASTWEHYQLTRTGDSAEGTATFGGATSQIRMVKLADGEAPHSAFRRPQEAALAAAGAPPYQERELVIDAPDGGKLAGTLTIPAGTGPFPVVVLLSGSGQQDRDESIFGHKPFLIVSDSLTRRGVATYRFDDRGTGKTVGAPVSLDTEIADAGAIIDALKKQKELDPKHVGLLGHSAAGAVAPFAALKHPVAFIALLAGTTTTGIAYAAYQTEHSMRVAGLDEAAIAQQNHDQAAITSAALKGPKEVEAALNLLVEPKLEAALGRRPTPEELKQAIAKPLAETTNPWTVSYFRLDPAVAWKKLKPIPVLLLVGDKDTQVPYDLTIKSLEAATTHRKNVTTHVLPGLNHLFQHAQTGEVGEYLTNEETFDPAALDTLTTWIAAQK